MRYLDVHPREVGDLGGEAARIVNGTWRHVFWTQHAVRDGNPVIVLAERGGLVDDAGTVLRRDVSVVEDAEGPVLELRGTGQLSTMYGCGSGTSSVKYSKTGTYLHPFISVPLKVASFLNLAFLGSL